MPTAPEPRAESRRVRANGLEHHYLEWSAALPSATVLLLHGYMDAAGTWDRVAPVLARSGYRVVAPDMRGFGEGPRTPAGSYYHFSDYVADLADFVDAVVDAPTLFLVGHSMGGTVATYFTGAFDGRVSKLVLCEGLGPPDNPFDVAPDRMRRWIEDVRSVRAKEKNQRIVGSFEEAFRRLLLNHPGIDPEVLRGRLPHLVETLPDGRIKWRFDPLHKTLSPSPFYAAHYNAFAARIACPVLAVGGGPEGFHPPDEDQRLGCFQRLERHDLPGAGHMMHWTRPAELTAAILSFIRS
ncbi:MAG: alpha/beta hydrolase [Polyangiaceae bacterium]